MPPALHPLLVRVTHWVNAYAIVCMVTSGWAIYNASPLFPFTFPAWATLGGWLGGAIAWHLAVMWLMLGNALVYLAGGLLSGRLRRVMLPVSPARFAQDLKAALTFRLDHRDGVYNAVQRLAYITVLLLGGLAVLSGLALWKPVTLPFAELMGGYEVARRIHFIAMAGIVGFVVIHLALVALVPRTLLSILFGRIPDASTEKLP